MRLPTWRYEQLKEIATTFIVKYVRNIPVDLYVLANSLCISVIPYSKLTQGEIEKLKQIAPFVTKDAFTYHKGINGTNKYYIYFNDNISIERIRFTLMHEIAHIVLKHSEQSDLAEAEANFFAKYTLAPPELINQIRPNDYLDIATAFKLSNECAYNAFIFYNKWKKINNARGNIYTEYEENMISTFSENIQYLKKVI